MTVYTDVGHVTRLLQIESTQTITTLLVDQSGNAFWCGEGGYDDQLAAALEQAVVAAATPPAN